MGSYDFYRRIGILADRESIGSGRSLILADVQRAFVDFHGDSHRPAYTFSDSRRCSEIIPKLCGMKGAQRLASKGSWPRSD